MQSLCVFALYGNHAGNHCSGVLSQLFAHRFDVCNATLIEKCAIGAWLENCSFAMGNVIELSEDFILLLTQDVILGWLLDYAFSLGEVIKLAARYGFSRVRAGQTDAVVKDDRPMIHRPAPPSPA